jgi:hypothetical protein
MVKRAQLLVAVIVVTSLILGATPESAQAQLFQGPAQGTSPVGQIVNTTSFPVVPPTSPFEDWRAPKHHIDLWADPPGMPSALRPLGSNQQDDLSRFLMRGPSMRAPGLVTDFEGITLTPFIPPDPIMAAGPNHLMGLVNTSFAIFSKTGTNLQQISARSWFNNVSPTNNAFDPKVFYDHFVDRWVMVWIAGDFATYSEILISVSDDSDPSGDWCNFVMRGDVNGSTPDSTGVDYQGVGFDEDAVYVSANNFSMVSGFFSYVKLRIIPKSTLYDPGCPAVTWTDFWDLRDPTFTGVTIFTVRPAHTFGTPGVEYLINDSPFVTGMTMTLWSLTNPLSPTPTLTGTNVPVASRLVPPDADQLGGSTTLIDVGGPRVRNAVYRDGSIWTAHSVADASGQYARARYVRIDVTGPTVLEDVAFGADGCWLYYPAIMADTSSNMVMVYNQSCTDEYIGIRYTGRTTMDVGLQPSAELKAGEANYVLEDGNERNRWGDYSGIALDPADGNRIWMYAEYAKTPANRWGTWFGEVVPVTLGDINDDGFINVADVILLVDFILERSTPNGLEFVAADCTPEGVLDIGDVVCLVNLVLSSPAALMASAPDGSRVRQTARLSEAAVDPISGQRTVLLETELGQGVAGLQAHIKYDPSRVRIGRPQATERAAGFDVAAEDTNGELVVLLFGQAGAQLEGGDGPLLRLPLETLAGADEEDLTLELTQVKLADLSGAVRRAELGRSTLTALPARFQLSEPYPNPVGRAGTALELEIPEATSPALYGEAGAWAGGSVRVVVEIFNVRGQKIRTVMAQELTPGRHTIQWDGRSDRGELVGAGLYVLRLQAGPAVETRKLIVSSR